MDRSGENNLFYEAIWSQAGPVLRMALFLTNHHQSDAEDIVQETMLKAYRSLGSFVPGTDAKSWLLSILRNTWIDRVRARKARPEIASVEEMLREPAAAESSASEAEWTDADAVLSRFGDRDMIAALNELPEDLRWTLLLIDVQGLEQSEAAAVMGVPEGTVKSRTHRGRRLLRDLLLPKALELGYLDRVHDPDRSGQAEVNQ